MLRTLKILTLTLICARFARADALSDKPFTQKIPDTEVSFEMMPVPAGTFRIGSPASEPDRRADEGPQFDVHVDAFWMGKTVVTWPEYNAFYDTSFRVVNAGRAQIPKDRLADAVTYPTPLYEVNIGPSLARMGRGKGFPAVSMSQYAARQYTKWLSKKTGRFYRLPTEAEWEYACRAGSTTAYNFGNDAGELRDHGWYLKNSSLKDGDPGYHSVASMPANKWGLFDMHGNVGQWCIDQYDPAWYGKFAGKAVDWRDCINWPAAKYPIIVRGGGYESEAADCRSASRLHSTKAFNSGDGHFPQSAHWESTDLWVGFRLVSPANEPDEAEKQKFWDDPDPITKSTVQNSNDQVKEIIVPSKK